jgi:tetratricopeptide (TPR) repeat protein
MAVRYYHLADLYLDMRENEKAFEYCNKTLSVAEEIAAKPLATECNFLMGKYYMSEEMYKKAIDHFSTALSMVEKNNYKTLTANIYLWYAKAFLQLERIDEAIEKANSAYNEARALNLSTVKKDASYLLFKCFEKKGATGKALNWFEIYFNISDSINYYEQQKEIQRIEAHFNYEKQDRENEILRNKASLQEQLLKNRTITIFAMLLGIVLSIVTIILLISRMKYAKALNREQKMLSLQQLEQLNKELDGKKRELATKMMFLNQKNDLIGRIINQLQEIQNDPDVDYGEINSLVNELRNDAPQSNWKEFETQFVQVHPDFYKRLFKKYPDLTSYEQRICAFLRMNLNTKEIAAITGRSAKSIEVTRSRIRQKLQLSRKDNLGSFLASI